MLGTARHPEKSYGAWDARLPCMIGRGDSLPSRDMPWTCIRLHPPLTSIVMRFRR